MDSIIDESLDPFSRTPTAVDLITEMNALSDDLMPEVTSKIPTANAAASGVFLVENWLVGQGEG
jgi:hypothetical protein